MALANTCDHPRDHPGRCLYYAGAFCFKATTEHALLDLANKRTNDTRPSGRGLYACVNVRIWTVMLHVASCFFGFGHDINTDTGCYLCCYYATGVGVCVLYENAYNYNGNSILALV